MRISKSKLITYMKCPTEYEKRYIRDIREETPAMKRGKIVHEFVERCYDEGWFYIEEEMGEDILKVTKEEVPEKYTKYGDYLANFYQMEQKRLQQVKRKHGDNYKDYFFPIEQEIKLETRYSGHTLVGRIDAVYKTGDNQYMAVDYKTGRSYSPWTNKKQQETEINYYSLITHISDQISYETSKGRFSYIGDGGKVDYDISSKSLQRTRKIINRVAEKIEAGHFEHSDSNCELCTKEV